MPGDKPGDQAYQEAQKHKGAAYVYGAQGPDTFDCSGLMVYSYLHGPGITIPRVVSDIWSNQAVLSTVMPKGSKNAKDVKESDLEVGDMLCYLQPGNNGQNQHVKMYAGGGQTIEAPHTGANVCMNPLDLNGSGTEPFVGAKRVGGGGSSGGSGTDQGDNKKSDSPISGSQDTGSADTAYIDTALSDPRNNLPFSPLFMGSAGGFKFTYQPSPNSPLRQVSAAWQLVRGGIVQLLSTSDKNPNPHGQKGGQFAAFFMMNPSSISTDCTMSDQTPAPATMSATAAQIAPSWLAQQTISFSFIFNRMYEVWQGPDAHPGPNNSPGPGAIGVRWDIRAFERLMGMYDAVQQDTSVGAGYSQGVQPGLGASGAGSAPPASMPVQVVFGGPFSIQFQGYIASFDYTYTMFDANMVPVECTCDISILRQYLPTQSSYDLVNPMVTRMYGSTAEPLNPNTAAMEFPYATGSSFNAKTGIIQINRKGGISI